MYDEELDFNGKHMHFLIFKYACISDFTTCCGLPLIKNFFLVPEEDADENDEAAENEDDEDFDIDASEAPRQTNDPLLNYMELEDSEQNEINERSEELRIRSSVERNSNDFRGNF